MEFAKDSRKKHFYSRRMAVAGKRNFDQPSCMYVCTYVRMYVWAYVRNVRMYVRNVRNVRMYVRTYVRMYVCLCAHVGDDEKV